MAAETCRIAVAARKMTVQRCSLGSPGNCSTKGPKTAGTAASSQQQRSCGDDDADGDGEGGGRRSWKWAGRDDGSGQYVRVLLESTTRPGAALYVCVAANRIYHRAGKYGTAGQKGRWSPGGPGASGGGRAKLFDWPCLLAAVRRPYRDRNHRNRLPALHGTVASLNRNKWAL